MFQQIKKSTDQHLQRKVADAPCKKNGIDSKILYNDSCMTSRSLLTGHGYRGRVEVELETPRPMRFPWIRWRNIAMAFSALRKQLLDWLLLFKA